MNLVHFESWPDVLAYARTGGPLYYQAPLDRYATQLYAGKSPPGYEAKARTIRIYPPGSTGRGRNRTSDPFNADSGHLDRFSHPTEIPIEEMNMQAKRKTPAKGKGGSSGGANPRNNKQDTEAQHDDAMRVLRAEYYAGVRGLAQEVASRVAEGQEESDVLHEVVDGSYWVIYTHANFQVLMCSDHHDAYSEDFGEPPVSGNDINWAALAYAAMARDVSEQVQAGGVEEAPRGRMRASDSTMSIADIGDYLRQRRISAMAFWQDAMGGDMAPLPREDVIRIANKIARRGR